MGHHHHRRRHARVDETWAPALPYLPTCLGLVLAVLHVIPPSPRRVANAQPGTHMPADPRCLREPVTQSVIRSTHTTHIQTVKDASRMPAITVRPFFTQLNFSSGPRYAHM